MVSHYPQGRHKPTTGAQFPISPSLQPCIDAARDELDASIAKLDTLFSAIEDLGDQRSQHLDAVTHATYLWMRMDLVQDVKAAWRRLETMRAE
ncbi:hypothetical protein ACTJK4_21520 [Ralstonia sp. 22111]|uniref:hypothetical protein n=1 Tax=Ralstonia sp. 22111 TaxID=3453878 RepID=UPI003F87B9D1